MRLTERLREQGDSMERMEEEHAREVGGLSSEVEELQQAQLSALDAHSAAVLQATPTIANLAA